ncbi:hypothetical protein PSUM_25465 [Pseudomonas umsongensis]|jgi:hypothetical protein|uniref:Uncharacterized protein n=1 Tax=Pseudomonas umsongensis TaxID=198618 RepID=A0ABX4DQ55_9PSED|nr:hypothetical protein PSUM_25465 [Pseudomonas umsongensis]SDT70888.1 hypothetical protein SAMN04490206_4931 [Pseudomonas umsongensis]
MLAMDVNDYAGNLAPRSVLRFFAIMLAPTRASEQTPDHPIRPPRNPISHTKLGISQKNQYAAPHICASTRQAALIAPTRQMTFSPSPTAGRKIRVYVLKAGAVYQK